MDARKEISWPGWEVVRRIGSGSFGTVYEIQRDIYGDIEKSALKVITIPHNEDEVDYLRCSGLDDASITRTFHQQVGDIAKEYKLMAQLRENPNIVRCDDFRDIQHDDGLGWDIYIKMELLTPLMKCLDRVSTEEQIIHMGMDICNALIDCQKKNIIHRDIKPQNVFVSESGRFKLGDFGIARTIERTTHATAGIGTYSYMAPEVERNEQYGKTADIYSLGLMMYWLLNERRGPFMPLPPTVPKYGDEEQARRRRFAGEPIPNPQNGSDKLKAIVMRACSFKPEDRFESANKMFAALRELVEKHTVIPASEHLPSGQDVQNTEDLTVEGPQWGNKTEQYIAVEQAPEPVVDDDATVGPGWESKSAVDPIPNQELEEDDATVGPVFARQQLKAETPKSHKTVAAQPDTGREKRVLSSVPEDKQTGGTLPNGFWRCICGREHPNYVSSCVCGNSKNAVRERILSINKSKQDATTERTKKDAVCPVCGHKQEGQHVCWRCGHNYNARNNEGSTIKETIDNVVAVQANAAGEIICPACGHKQKGHQVCWKCGQKLSVKAFRGNSWQCVCGRNNPAYVSTCCCGINKYNMSNSLPPNRTTLLKENADREYVPGRLYYNGDEVSFEGQKYICVAPEGTQCVGSPVQQSKQWQLIVKQPTEDWRKSEAAHRAWLKSLEKDDN